MMNIILLKNILKIITGILAKKKLVCSIFERLGEEKFKLRRKTSRVTEEILTILIV